MSSSSSSEESIIQPILKKHKKRRYGQRIPKELANLRAQANNKYVFGEIEETKRILEIMIKKYPFYQEAYRVYGLICLDQNNLSKATNYFMLAAKRKGSSSLWIKIAQLLKSQGRFDLASIYFGKVLKKNPTNIQIMWERVGCFEQSEEYGRAMLQLEKLKQIGEELNLKELKEETTKRMAKICVKRNQLSEAKQLLHSLEYNDSVLNMLCQILELENNYDEMRQLLDKVFGVKTMSSILKSHDYKIICFYILCGFNDFQMVVDYYQNNPQAISHLIELSEKVDKKNKEQLLEILYEYRNQFVKESKEDILIKYANYVQTNNEKLEAPEEPELPNNKDQILYIYNKILTSQDPNLVTQNFLKILRYEQKSIQKQHQIQQIKQEDTMYLFGKSKKIKKKNKFLHYHKTKKETNISTIIGHSKFFELALYVFKLLLETNNSYDLFQVTYKIYQLRLKKIAHNDMTAYLKFVEQLSNYGLWASLVQKQYLIAPIYLRYIRSPEVQLHMISIIYKHIAPEQRALVNSFTRSLESYEKSHLSLNIKSLLNFHSQNPEDPLTNLLIALSYLQVMTGRLAINQEDWMKKTLYYFDQYRVFSTDQIEVKYNLARIYLHLNIVNKGMELMEQIVNSKDSHPLVQRAGFCLMQLNKKLGNQEQALYYLKTYNTLV